jgi:hypothetical protein
MPELLDQPDQPGLLELMEPMGQMGLTELMEHKASKA